MMTTVMNLRLTKNDDNEKKDGEHVHMMEERSTEQNSEDITHPSPPRTSPRNTIRYDYKQMHENGLSFLDA